MNEFYAYMVIGCSIIDWRNSVTLDELLETVSPEVKQAIEDICERAGTWDAEWSVLKAAGELLAENENFNT
jgi:hypothetical protein